MVSRNTLISLSLSVGVFLSTLSPGHSATGTNNSDICAGIITKAEMRETIPLHLLRAISLVESGKWDKEKGARVAWPWTVMAEGKGRYLNSKQAAIAEVNKLKAKGVTNIDVGCMQINLYHHSKAFSSLEEAFDPVKNVAYAAKFLTDLRKRSPSWTSAVGRYHSYNQKYSTPYRRKVLKAWRDEKHRLNQEIRLAALKKKSEKKAAKARNPGGVKVSHLKTTSLASARDEEPKTNSSGNKTPPIQRAKTLPITTASSKSPIQSNIQGRSIATRILTIKIGQNS